MPGVATVRGVGVAWSVAAALAGLATGAATYRLGRRLRLSNSRPRSPRPVNWRPVLRPGHRNLVVLAWVIFVWIYFLTVGGGGPKPHGWEYGIEYSQAALLAVALWRDRWGHAVLALLVGVCAFGYLLDIPS